MPLNKKRFLIIAPNTFPSDHSFLENVFVKTFPKAGHEVFFILNGLDHVFPWKIEKWGATTVFVRPRVKQKSLLNRFLNSVLIRLNTFLILLLVFRVRPDIIFVRSELFPCLIAITFSVLSKKKIKVCYHYNWPLYEKTLLKLKRIKDLGTLLKKIERLFQQFLLSIVFNKADYIFTISEAMRNMLILEGRINGKKVSALPLAANVIEDLSLKYLPWRQSIRQKLSLKNKFITIYIGSLDELREPEILIETTIYAKEFVGMNFHLLIVGATSEQKRALLQKANVRGVSDYITIMERIKRESIAEFICAADVGFSPIPVIPIFEISSPTKIYEYMAAGCPFVSSKIPEVVSLLEKSRAGLLSDHNARSYAAAIKIFYEDEDLIKRCGREGLRFTQEIHNYEILSYNFLQKITNYE